MLSNHPPTSSLHARHRHRRQNSTPTAFEGVKIQPLPNNVQRQRALGHRRGLSLDTRRQVMSPTTATRQDFATVSITNNTGLAQQPQHVLREAQQQRIQARPGPRQQAHFHQQQQQQQQQQLQHQQHMFVAANDHENYLVSPNGTPQTQRFDASCFDSTPIQFDQYGNPINGMMAKNQQAYGANMGGNKDFELFGPDTSLSTPSFMNFSDAPNTPQGWISEGDTASTRRSSRRISNGIMDRVNKFETMGIEQMSRPMTPPHQNANNYFPPTPTETPHDRAVKHEPMSARPSRFADGYDESMEETLKPTRKSNQRTQNIFEEMRRQSEQNAMPGQPQPTQVTDGAMYEQVPTADFMNMNNFNAEFMKIQGGYDGITDDFNGSDLSAQSTPHTPLMNFHAAFDHRPDLRHPNIEISSMSPARSLDMSCRTSPHRRTESLASIASAASIASINIEETKTETGVTLEDIANYIQGPDPADGKWTCVYDDCGKKFGRKENIKSHVQTHLNDRQYQCPTCKKCFVRQHDLKRHAKIHTGIKPYPCECGNSFARHDALTRHRQRGMCIGAFDGIVKKVVKRGRPRKHRPEMDERVNKSARTRTKNKSTTSTSSQSGYSDSSAVNSPENDFMMSDDHFEMGGISIERPGLDMPLQITTVSSAPMPSSPPRIHRELDIEPSPAASHNSGYVSPEALMEAPASLPQQPESPSKSEYNTPPELSQSSSPPPNQFFDAEPNASGFSDDSLLAGMRGTSGAVGNTSISSLGLGDPDDEMLMKAFTSEEGLVQFDRDPNMLMMSKFDEEFDDAVNMFTNNDDIFFGSS
ncbi:Metallothionein expression activator 1 [Colletotrichum truncatum]|uniref:Metallothionein expression activator 1 n=1 Tax=Colletotrichum truncatum TaxID=5467 RepID=A0ACC3Z6K9_COLTU|nr:Metallothionein expression activator 1 [Colletotrichum truncatum]KAF6787997.1 Metallothionein expression activator 1 [Colletotrichum truncatum]